MELQEIANLKSEKKIRDELVKYNRRADIHDFFNLKSPNPRFIYSLLHLYDKGKIASIEMILDRNDQEVLEEVIDKVDENELAEFFTKKKVNLGDIQKMDFIPLFNKLVDVMSIKDIAKMASNNTLNDKTYDFLEGFMDTLISLDPQKYFDTFIKTVEIDKYADLDVFNTYSLREVDAKYFENFIDDIVNKLDYKIETTDKSEYGKFTNFFSGLTKRFNSNELVLEFSAVEKLVNFAEKKMYEISDIVEDENEAPRVMSNEYTRMKLAIETFVEDRIFRKTEVPSYEKFKEYKEYVDDRNKFGIILNNVSEAVADNFNIHDILIKAEKNLIDNDYILSDPEIANYIDLDYPGIKEFAFSSDVIKNLVKIHDNTKLPQIADFAITNSDITPDELVKIGVFESIDIYSGNITSMLDKGMKDTDYFNDTVMKLYSYERYLKTFDYILSKDAIYAFLEKIVNRKAVKNGKDFKKKRDHALQILQLFNKQY